MKLCNFNIVKPEIKVVEENGLLKIFVIRPNNDPRPTPTEIARKLRCFFRKADKISEKHQPHQIIYGFNVKEA